MRPLHRQGISPEPPSGGVPAFSPSALTVGKQHRGGGGVCVCVPARGARRPPLHQHLGCLSHAPPPHPHQTLRDPHGSPDEGRAGPRQGEQQEEAARPHGGGAAGAGAGGGAGGRGGGTEAGGSRCWQAATPPCPAAFAVFVGAAAPLQGFFESADGLKLQPAASREGGPGRGLPRGVRGRGCCLTPPPPPQVPRPDPRCLGP